MGGTTQQPPWRWDINSVSQPLISLPVFSPRRRLTRSAGCNLRPLNATARPGERSWPWSGMASTTLPPSLPQMQESLSALAHRFPESQVQLCVGIGVQRGLATDRSRGDLSSAWAPKTEPCMGEFGHGDEFSERHLLEFGYEDRHPGGRF